MSLLRKKLADVKDVVNRIEDNIYNEALADELIHKVEDYVKTKNNRVDLTNQDAHMVYRNTDYDEVAQLSKKRKLDIDWTSHGKYRSELRDIDHDDVNDRLIDRMKDILIDPKKKKRDKRVFKEPDVGHLVVDYDLTTKPSEVDVITVHASEKENMKTAKKLLLLAKELVAVEFLPEIEDFDKFVDDMSDAQRVYADQFAQDDRLSDAQKRMMMDLRNLDWKGKCKSSSAFLVEMRKAVVSLGDFTAVNMIKVAKQFNKLKYCLARERNVAVYVSGFKDIVEIAQLAKAFREINADEVSLEKHGSQLWADWSEKVYSLENYIDEDLSECELRIYWS